MVLLLDNDQVYFAILGIFKTNGILKLKTPSEEENDCKMDNTIIIWP